MPFCRECGKKVQDDWVTCPYCSHSIKSASSSEIQSNNDVSVAPAAPKPESTNLLPLEQIQQQHELNLVRLRKRTRKKAIFIEKSNITHSSIMDSLKKIINFTDQDINKNLDCVFTIVNKENNLFNIGTFEQGGRNSNSGGFSTGIKYDDLPPFTDVKFMNDLGYEDDGYTGINVKRYPYDSDGQIKLVDDICTILQKIWKLKSHEKISWHYSYNEFQQE